MLKNKLIRCRTCDNDVSSEAKICPHCGAKLKKYGLAQIWEFITGLLEGGGD